MGRQTDRQIRRYTYIKNRQADMERQAKRVRENRQIGSQSVSQSVSQSDRDINIGSKIRQMKTLK